MTAHQPARLAEDGRFPFGLLNGPRPARPAESGVTRQLVIGTYPSALHVGWQAPAYARRAPGTTGRVASLAVDVEPEVFWAGKDAPQRVDAWKAKVGFIEGDEPGTHGRLTVATNGPSGGGLLTEYFPALPFTDRDTAFLDVYPVYCVKKGTASQRGQADAIEQEYNAIVETLSGASTPGARFETATLPLRPSPATLPSRAAERFSGWLVGVVADLKPDHIVTLGEEVWQTLELAHLVRRACAPSLGATRHGGYGEPGELEIAGSAITWTALAHPGAIRQSAGTPGSWGAVHRTWLESNRIA